MSSPLQFKVYNQSGEHIASVRFAELAAALVGMHDDGKVKVNGRIVWREGKEEDSAGNSYDAAAEIMLQRVRQHHQEHYDRMRQGRERFLAQRAYSSTLGMVSIPENN